MAGETLDAIRAAIGSAIPGAGLTREGTLTKKVDGARTPGQLTSGPGITDSAKTFQGFADSNVRKYFSGSTVRNSRAVVVMIGASIQDGAVPEQGDYVSVDGVVGTLLEVNSDPAKATYTCAVVK